MPTQRTSLQQQSQHQQQQQKTDESSDLLDNDRKRNGRVADNTEADTFKFDDIFVELGEFGRQQKIVYAYMCVAMLLYGQVTLTYVFTAGDLNYR